MLKAEGVLQSGTMHYGFRVINLWVSQMKMYALLCLVAVLFAPIRGALGEEVGTPQKLQSPILVELPIGEIEIDYIEGKFGMTLMAKCKGVSLTAHRIYLGDGKIAVLFEGTNDGFFTPNGKVNAAGLRFSQGHNLRIPANKVEAWGEKPGEVYLRSENLKFFVQDDS